MAATVNGDPPPISTYKAHSKLNTMQGVVLAYFLDSILKFCRR